ncbi:TGF-beta-activated kinase 1 and MAP3K7-binding protein 2-like [Watersipora subatra]|uniref:TGF-beta-activated kinase 1 and MAP3K7-binding protein 2-like n=1 Tax=Watersipora subatra TaxID=2589382 RepID=UPI00355B4BD6
MSGIDQSSMAQILSGTVPESLGQEENNASLSSLQYQAQEERSGAMLTPSNSLHDLVGLTDGETGNWLNQLQSNDFDLGAQLLNQEQFSFGNMTMDEFTDQVLRTTDPKPSGSSSHSAFDQPTYAKPQEACTGNEFDTRGVDHLSSVEFQHAGSGSTGYHQHKKLGVDLSATSSEGMYPSRPGFYSGQDDESSIRSSMLPMFDPAGYDDPNRVTFNPIHLRNQFNASYQLSGFLGPEMISPNQQPHSVHLSISPNQHPHNIEHALSPNHHSPNIMSPNHQAQHPNSLLSPRQQVAGASQHHTSSNQIPAPIKVSPDALFHSASTGWQIPNQCSPSKYVVPSSAPPQWLAQGPPSTCYSSSNRNPPSLTVSPNSCRSNPNGSNNYPANLASPNKCSNDPSSPMSYSANPVSPSNFASNTIGSANYAVSPSSQPSYIPNPISSNNHATNSISSNNHFVNSISIQQPFPFVSCQTSTSSGSLPIKDRRKNTERSLRECGLYDAAMLTKRLVQRDKEIQSGMDDFKAQLAEFMQGLTVSDS